MKALTAAGLVEPTRKGFWSITRAGKALSSATAAPRVKRVTAERALGEFLGRVDYVNRRPFFLARVVEVVLFGSMLKPEVDRVSDVDLAVEIVPKESNPERARRSTNGACWNWSWWAAAFAASWTGNCSGIGRRSAISRAGVA